MSLRCGRNLRIRLPTECPRYSQMLTTVNSRQLSDIHGLVTGQIREDTQGFKMVDIGTILGLVYLILEEDQCWLVNTWINRRTINEIY